MGIPGIPGIDQVYAKMNGIYIDLYSVYIDINSIYTGFIPGICNSGWYLPGIYQLYAEKVVYTWYIPGIYQYISDIDQSA
jgi:hypothetical protein